ncbi:MAG TPA: hypothetical protein VK557_15295, partial [Pyrinomonadaceae bacterium]|nr:hypothetical protein [Pyrinomonadaceae bacterium]
ATSVTHLARYPDRSEIEGLIKGRELFLGESAESTLSGIFESCQRFEQEVCAEMVSIWNLRRLDPLLILQPIEQWRVKIKTNTFPGYEAREAFVPSELNLHESSAHRMKCAAVGDADRVEVWEGSPWTE